MLATKGHSSILNPISAMVYTTGEIASPLTGNDDDSQRWERIVDHQLIEWGWNPSALSDDGIDPPSRDVIQRAIQLAHDLRDGGIRAPDRVVPDPNGGIVFELRRGDICELIHIWDDGTMEYRRFQGTRLVERQLL